MFFKYITDTIYFVLLLMYIVNHCRTIYIIDIKNIYLVGEYIIAEFLCKSLKILVSINLFKLLDTHTSDLFYISTVESWRFFINIRNMNFK